MTTITFNSKTSAYGETNSETNLEIIRHNERYLTELLKAHGYVYLSTIYELLGVKWNPEWENLCLLYKPNAKVTLAIRCVNGDGFDIDIL